MWVVDLLLVLPSFLIIAILSPRVPRRHLAVPGVLLAVFQWMITARIVRGMTLTLREREFVKAARFMGVPPWRIILRHILPNMASLLIIDATHQRRRRDPRRDRAVVLRLRRAAAGRLARHAHRRRHRLRADVPVAVPVPGGLLVVTVLSVNLIGDGLRDALDPELAPAGGRRMAERANRCFDTDAAAQSPDRC